MFRPAKTPKRSGFLFLLVFATAVVLTGCGASSGSHSSPAASGWHLLPEAPSAIAAGRTSVWTGTEMIISGTNPGADGTFIRSVEVAEAYNPATREWRKLASPPKTESFCHRDAVWTGKEMLVWGCDFVAFNPKANEWRRLPVPLTREGIVVWTGRELIVWGGVIGTPVGTSIPAKYLADGAAFRPNDTGDRSTAAARARPTSRTRPRQLIAQRPSTPLPACC